MALSSLSSSIKLVVSWVAQKVITGSDYAPTANSTNINKTVALGTSSANNTAGGSDEVVSFIQSINASSSATIDLTALTDILGAACTLARVKGIVIRLLSVADDAVVGTAAAFLTIGNNAANDFISQAGSGWLASATSVLDVPNGGFVAFSTPSALGVAVDATHKIIKILNGSASVAAKVQISLIGGTS